MIMKDFVLQQTKFVELVQTRIVKDGQQNNDWFWVRRVNSQPAVVIVATIGNKLVVTRELRIPIKRYEYGLPAGLIDPGESIKETVIREIKEETGLDFVRFTSEPSPAIYNSSGLTDESCFIAFIEVSGEISNKNLQDNEDITTYLMSKEEVKKLLHQENISFSAKAWLIFKMFCGELFF